MKLEETKKAYQKILEGLNSPHITRYMDQGELRGYRTAIHFIEGGLEAIIEIEKFIELTKE